MTALEKVSTRRLLSLAASAFVVLAAEPLYLLVDTAVVGHLGSVPLAGLGVASALMALLLDVIPRSSRVRIPRGAGLSPTSTQCVRHCCARSRPADGAEAAAEIAPVLP